VLFAFALFRKLAPLESFFCNLLKSVLFDQKNFSLQSGEADGHHQTLREFRRALIDLALLVPESDALVQPAELHLLILFCLASFAVLMDSQ